MESGIDTRPRGRLTKARQRLRDIRRLRGTRALVQLAFAAFIVVAAVRHQTEQNAPSVDALCPFGAVETLITWLTTGAYISKIHPSNLVLGLAVLVGTLLVGNAFCGWVCPFGALQDALAWLRKRTHLPAVTIPRRVDRVLRWGRFLVLAAILFFSVTTAQLWFADYDPYLTVFGLHWLFGFESGVPWVALGILAAVVVASVVVDRFWCRYLCPLGAVFSLTGRISLLRIRRSRAACTDCGLCDKPCPVDVKPAAATRFVSTDCVGCMDCLAACPVKGALQLEPTFLGLPLKREDAGARPAVRAGATR